MSESTALARLSHDRCERDWRTEPHAFAKEFGRRLMIHEHLPMAVMIVKNRCRDSEGLAKVDVLCGRVDQASVFVASEFMCQPQDMDRSLRTDGEKGHSKAWSRSVAS